MEANRGLCGPGGVCAETPVFVQGILSAQRMDTFSLDIVVWRGGLQSLREVQVMSRAQSIGFFHHWCSLHANKSFLIKN